MIGDVAGYALLVVAISLAAVLVTSRIMAEKLVAVGLMPKAFLGLLPMLHTAIRVIGGVLVISGLTVIGVQSGWLNRDLLEKYALPGAIVVLGLALLLLKSKERN